MFDVPYDLPDELDELLKGRLYPSAKYLNRDVGIWDDEYDPYKKQRKIFKGIIDKEIEPLKKEISQLKENISFLNKKESVPKSFLKYWVSEEEDIWDEY